MLGSAIGGVLAVAGTLGVRDAVAACKGYLQSCLAHADCCTGYCSSIKRCLCPPGSSLCNGACVAKSSFKTDPHNCGGCNHHCPAGSSCVNGACDPPAPACTPPGGYGPGLTTAGIPCEAIKFTWSTRPGTDFYVISIDGVAEPPTTATTLTKTGLPHKTSGSYTYCFQQGKNGCPALSDPVCGSFNTKGCPTP
jgi:hypothetical protein